MRNVFLALSLISVINFASNAQEVGIKIGGNLSNMSYSSGAYTTYPSSILGLQIGLVTDAAIGRHWVVQPGVMLSQKGYQVHNNNGRTDQLRINYLEIPVNFFYMPSRHLSIGGGPYFAYGLTGTLKNLYADGTIVQRDVNLNTGGDYERGDVGLNLAAGFEFAPTFVLGLNYSMGVSNISNDNGVVEKNTTFGISLTKYFSVH